MHIREYQCNIQLVEYKDHIEYEGYIVLLPNIVASGKTSEECYNELYGNLDAYLTFCDENKIVYPMPYEKPLAEQAIDIVIKKKVNMKDFLELTDKRLYNITCDDGYQLTDREISILEQVYFKR